MAKDSAAAEAGRKKSGGSRKQGGQGASDKRPKS